MQVVRIRCCKGHSWNVDAQKVDGRSYAMQNTVKLYSDITSQKITVTQDSCIEIQTSSTLTHNKGAVQGAVSTKLILKYAMYKTMFSGAKVCCSR